MNRTEKHEQVTTLHERFARAKHAFLVDFKGLSVTQDTELRNLLRDANVDYRVVKNRLAKLALKETDLEAMERHFVGPTAIALSEADPAAVAKVLVDFAKKNDKLEIKAGILEGGFAIDAQQVKALSELPSLPELRAILLSVIQMPATRLVSTLAEPGRQFARLLDARREDLEKAS